MRARVIALLVPLCLLLVGGQVFGQRPIEVYTPPYEMPDKDLNPLYGRYEIYEADRYRGGLTTEAEAQARVGQELIVTATLFRALRDRIENPTYTVWFYPLQPRHNVPPRAHRWSSHYYGLQGQAPGNEFYGDEVIKVYKPGGSGPWLNLEPIGTDELWVRSSGWYYKARKTTRPVVSAGHEDYCQVMGPCSAGQGDCDSDAECQIGLTCAEDVGATYGFAADVDVCEAPAPSTLRGFVDVVSRLHSNPLTLYGWAYNTAASTDTIPVEIYVGGVRGAGTLAATITADQPRSDVNTTFGITGDHGFAWAVPAQYQSGAQDFYVYALDQTPNPSVRTLLSPAPLRLREVGHHDYCWYHGPCVAGQGDCDGDSKCQSGLTCVDDVGATYGFAADMDVCEGPPT